MSVEAEVRDLLEQLGCSVTVCAASVDRDQVWGVDVDVPVTPASVMKVQVAQALLGAIADGRLDGDARVRLSASRRTPGPVGVSLMSDDVELSLRDLVVPMLTISDNAATDAAIEAVGLSEVNAVTVRLGLAATYVESDLATMLDAMAREAGFADYASLAAYQPGATGPSAADVEARLAESAALDPARGSRTSAGDTVALLRAIWRDEAGPAQACEGVRWSMARQLTRHRIASGFPADVTVAAKSGGLMGVIRNEAGVVRFPDGTSYAVAVFTRLRPGACLDPREVDAAIGAVAARAVAVVRG